MKSKAIKTKKKTPKKSSKISSKISSKKSLKDVFKLHRPIRKGEFYILDCVHCRDRFWALKPDVKTSCKCGKSYVIQSEKGCQLSTGAVRTGEFYIP